MMSEHLYSAVDTAAADIVYLHYCHADSLQQLFVILC